MKQFKDINNILILLATITAFVMAGTFLYTDYLYKKPLPDNNSEMNALLADSGRNIIPASFDLNKTTINLRSSSGRLRFLDVNLHLVPFNNEYYGHLERKSDIIYDLLIQIAGQYSPSDLNSLTGKMIFEEKFKTTLNKKLGNNIIKEIYFSKFVIQ
ncbi:MAG: flagellar basal body-associated FliL family protein [Bdellovibrionales bacterium]|jgi:flagellar protein FliL|nr:flagellar basal body-associated FliL family protein [Bdellovibrionales bacterium]